MITIIAIETHNTQNNPHEIYSGINFIRKGFQSRDEVMRDENVNLVADVTEWLSLWKNYFDKLLNIIKAPVESNLGEIHTADLRIDEPSEKEIATAIKKLINNKASGIDDLPSGPLPHKTNL